MKSKLEQLFNKTFWRVVMKIIEIDHRKNEILRDRDAGMTYKTLAYKYGISSRSIYKRIKHWQYQRDNNIIDNKPERTGNKNREEFSKEFLARQKYNNEVNKKHIKYVKGSYSGEYSKIIHSICGMEV